MLLQLFSRFVGNGYSLVLFLYWVSETATFSGCLSGYRCLYLCVCDFVYCSSFAFHRWLLLPRHPVVCSASTGSPSPLRLRVYHFQIFHKCISPCHGLAFYGPLRIAKTYISQCQPIQILIVILSNWICKRDQHTSFVDTGQLEIPFFTLKTRIRPNPSFSRSTKTPKLEHFPQNRHLRTIRASIGPKEIVEYGPGPRKFRRSPILDNPAYQNLFTPYTNNFNIIRPKPKPTYIDAESVSPLTSPICTESKKRDMKRYSDINNHHEIHLDPTILQVPCNHLKLPKVKHTNHREPEQLYLGLAN